MELGAIETIKEAVKCGIGIGVLPRRSVLRETAAGELVERDLPGWRNRRFICFVCRDEEPLSPQVRMFREFIVRRIKAGEEGEAGDDMRAEGDLRTEE